ncbi:MAG TPA: methyltransferase domain-containing protein [Anaerolineales bacterium]|nr:methyltransferase domain-containing protein [Anaerolineales bacterium]
MEPNEYEIMYHVEDHHWWYRGMEAITRKLINQHIQTKTKIKILDAGCGTGAAMTTYLKDYGEVTGIDLYPQALDFCRKRNAKHLARASVLDLPLATASFDMVTSFDVLYEKGVMHEMKALKEFFRVLTPQGKLLMRLPAYDWLRGEHDERVHTNRRYTKNLVKKLLEQSGFIVEHLSYANTILFPLAVIKRLTEKILPSKSQSDLTLETGKFNELLKRILASEAFFVSKFGLPYGLSIFAVARK